MKSHLFFLFLIFLSLPIFPSPDIKAPETCAQGDLVRIIVGKQLHGCTGDVVLLDPAGRIVTKTPFFSAADPTGVVFTCALIGIGSTHATGTWTLRISGVADGIRFTEERRLEVESGRFRSEEIPLDERMSDLRQSDDPRKEEESRELAALLSEFAYPALQHTGVLILPIENPVRTSFYGDRRTYLYADGLSRRSIHYGVDYAALRGTPVVAAGAGEVIFAAARIITGNTVVIEHLPGFFTLYYHLDSLEVTAAQTVERGQRIGTVGRTGLATGFHLHWEARAALVPVEPESLLAEPLLF